MCFDYIQVECGRGPISRVVPSFVHKLLALEVPLVSVVVDDSRHALYSLNAKGFVELFDLGPTGVELMTFIGKRETKKDTICVTHSSLYLLFHPRLLPLTLSLTISLSHLLPLSFTYSLTHTLTL